MGFRFWYEGTLFILFFLFIVGLPCFFVAFLGTKMMNDLGNFPTKTAKIQMNIIWKLLLVEIFSFGLLTLFFHIFS
jgi:hypothetical protein